MRMVRCLWLAVLLMGMGSAEAMAGKADVVDVKVTREPAGTYRFDVTVSSDDTGWDKYADRWDVVAPDGTVLGTRVLAHPHETEQPFTRSQPGIAIPADVTSVTVRAHDKAEGYGGAEMNVALPAR
ncbi:MAG: hypothetical protein KDK75_13665 [Alphaproteobacteria bacterium]|nr:hypothetical protein [Alphaproteobacteria bacterium]